MPIFSFPRIRFDGIIGSSPYTHNLGQKIALSQAPQKIISAGPDKVQRFIIMFFSKPTLLAGNEAMDGAILVPGKYVFETTDAGGPASEWWAASEYPGAEVSIIIKSSDQVAGGQQNSGGGQPQLEDIPYEYVSRMCHGQPVMNTMIRYTGNKDKEIIFVSLKLTGDDADFINEEYRVFSVLQSQPDGYGGYYNAPEFLMMENNNETASFEWNTKEYPYLYTLTSHGEGMGYGILQITKRNIIIEQLIWC